MSGDAQTERFKWAMLRVAVGDPWNTGMATADAISAFPNLTRPQVDQVVRVALMELLDAGFIFFFRATSFDDEFAPRDETDALDRAAVSEVLAEQHDESDFPLQHEIGLSLRATKAGEDYFATLPDDASRLFPGDASGEIRVAGLRESPDST